jgi:hypothetical protein
MSLGFWRRKKEKPTVEVERTEVEPTPTVVKDPVEAFIQRLQQILEDPSIIEKTGGILSTRIQLIVGGTPLLINKKGVEPFVLSQIRSTQADVFIRMSEKAAAQLADSETFTDFRRVYHELAAAKDKTSYITIKLQTSLEELRRLGYFRSNVLRILIDA